MMRLHVSVCVCTRNRPNDLRRALDSISGSTMPVIEVIVSDDSTDDRARDLVAAEYPHVLWQRGPRRGLGPNRNAALAASIGTHVLFLDDDAELGSNFLATCTAKLDGVPVNMRERTVVSGVERHPDGLLVVAHEQDYLGFQRRPYRSTEGLRTVVINSALFPRAVFEQHQFDEQLIYGYDEVDLCSRIVHSGFHILHYGDAVNLHRPSTVNRSFYKPHVESSRLYVTAKRRGLTERKRFAAALYLGVAIAHLTASSLRKGGRLRTRDVPSTVLRALIMLTRHVRGSRS